MTLPKIGTICRVIYTKNSTMSGIYEVTEATKKIVTIYNDGYRYFSLRKDGEYREVGHNGKFAPKLIFKPRIRFD